mgnify:CR=1 FL=1
MSHRIRFFSTLLISILLLTFYPILPDVQAAPPADPYADAAVASPILSLTIVTDNALGAPDGDVALVVGVGESLRLDLGDGEEGTGSSPFIMED